MENNNLNTLRILFIIKGVLSLLATLFIMVIFFGMGSFLVQDFNGPDSNQEELPFNPIALISSIGIFAILLSLGLTIITFLAAKYIGERRNHTFILVASVLNLLSGVLGLALGIFALIEINKRDVQVLFSRDSVSNDDIL